MQSLMSNLVPLSKERHKSTYIDTAKGYAFADGMSYVPALLREMPSLAKDYAVAFIIHDDKASMVALLGLQAGENLYVSADGQWQTKYVPIALRQHPFAAMVNPKQTDKKGIVCISESYAGLNTDGRGVALFDDEGTPSNFTTNVTRLVTESCSDAIRTEGFCAELLKHDLLTPLKAVLKGPRGEQRAISGLHVVNRERLGKLSGKALKTLQTSGALEQIYLHLQSIGNLQSLAERIETQANPRKLDA